MLCPPKAGPHILSDKKVKQWLLCDIQVIVGGELRSPSQLLRPHDILLRIVLEFFSEQSPPQMSTEGRHEVSLAFTET